MKLCIVILHVLGHLHLKYQVATPSRLGASLVLSLQVPIFLHPLDSCSRCDNFRLRYLGSLLSHSAHLWTRDTCLSTLPASRISSWSPCSFARRSPSSIVLPRVKVKNQTTTSTVNISASSGARNLRFREDVHLSVVYKPLRAYRDPPCHSRVMQRVVVVSQGIRVQKEICEMWRYLNW